MAVSSPAIVGWGHCGVLSLNPIVICCGEVCVSRIGWRRGLGSKNYLTPFVVGECIILRDEN